MAETSERASPWRSPSACSFAAIAASQVGRRSLAFVRSSRSPSVSTACRLPLRERTAITTITFTYAHRRHRHRHIYYLRRGRRGLTRLHGTCLHGHGRGGGGGRHLGDVTAYRGDSRCLTPQTHRVETQYLRTARLTVNYLLFIDSSSYGLPLRLVGHDRQHRIRILTSSRLVELTCSYPSRVRSG